MDEISKILWDEVRDSIELDRLTEKRKPIESQPKPSIKENIFQSVIEQREKWILSELERYRKTQVLAGIKDSARSISDESEEGQKIILDAVEKQFLNSQVKMTCLKEELSNLKEWGKFLDEEYNRDALLTWNSRCKSIDVDISRVKTRIPAPFYPNMINNPVSRFPAARIGQTESEGKYYDKWLMAALKSSKIIFFEPYDRYINELKRWSKEIYLPALQKEQEAERLANAPTPKELPPPPVEPQPKPPTWGAMLEQKEDDPTLSLPGRIKSRIYGGSKS